MATTERTRGGSLGSAAVAIVAIGVLILIGYSFWPKVKAAYYGDGKTTNVQSTQPTQPDTGKAELDRLRAQLAAMQAQLSAAQSKTIVQTVPEGQAAQPVTAPDPAVPPANTPGDPAAPAADPPAQRLIVLHENDNHGAPIVTGSGACQVAAKGARRCGSK